LVQGILTCNSGRRVAQQKISNGTVGLPGLSADPQTWQEPMGIIALAAESLMLIVAFWAYEAARHPRRILSA
jgi:hypothetical protein